MDHIASLMISILATKIKVKFAITHPLVKLGAIFKMILIAVSLKMVLIAIIFIKDIVLQM